MAKNTEKDLDNAVEVTTEGGAPEATEKVEGKKGKAKEYKFTSTNKFLTVSSLGVQFINGKATVTDVEVARALATIDGVELVED